MCVLLLTAVCRRIEGTGPHEPHDQSAGATINRSPLGFECGSIFLNIALDWSMSHPKLSQTPPQWCIREVCGGADGHAQAAGPTLKRQVPRSLRGPLGCDALA